MLSMRRKSKINGPFPLPLFGTGISMFYYIMRYGVNGWQRRMCKKYGNVYIDIIGSHPMVNVADPELAKNIGIKDFKRFPNRPVKFLKQLENPNNH